MTAKAVAVASDSVVQVLAIDMASVSEGGSEASGMLEDACDRISRGLFRRGGGHFCEWVSNVRGPLGGLEPGWFALEFASVSEQTPPRFTMATRRAIVISAAIVAACASTPYGATDANLAKARGAAPRGATLFHQQCAGCHGERGESGSGAPRILGEGALPEYPRARNLNADPAAGDPESLRLQAQSRPQGAPWRDPFRTAKDLHHFVSEKMPPSEEKRSRISPDDYWQIVDFMLRAHGANVPPAGVTESNARTVSLSVPAQ